MNKILILSLLVLGIGCSSPQLAKDEALALSYAQQLDGLLSSGAAQQDISALSSALLAVDPSSPTLQRLNTTVQSAQTAQALQDATIANKGVIVLLKAGQSLSGGQ